MDDAILTSLLEHAAHNHKTSAEDLVLEDVREVRDPSSILPPLDGPGLHTGLFEALYTANESNTELNVFLPQTVVFAFGRPTAWYSTQVVNLPNGTKKFVIRKRRVTALKTTLILRSFLVDGALLDDSDPRLITPSERRRAAAVPHVAVDNAAAGSNPAIIALFISTRHGIRYLDHALLKHLVLLAPSDERDGVLQQCVAPPSGRYHRRAEGLRVLWTPHVCLVDRRRNCVPDAHHGVSGRVGTPTSRQADDAPPTGASPSKKHQVLADATTMFQAETFEGSTSATAVDWPVRSVAQVGSLRKQASAVADHFTCVTAGQFVIDQMTLAMRITRSGDVVLQWAETVSVSEVVPIAPPPPNPLATPSALHDPTDDTIGKLLKERAPTFMRRRSTAPAPTLRKQSTQFFDNIPHAAESTRTQTEEVAVDPVLVFERSRLRHLPSVKNFISRKVLALARANSSKRSIGSMGAGGGKMSSASMARDEQEIQHEMPVLRFRLKKLTKYSSLIKRDDSPVQDDPSPPAGISVSDGAANSTSKNASAKLRLSSAPKRVAGPLVHHLAPARAEVFACDYCGDSDLPVSSRTCVSYGVMLEADQQFQHHHIASGTPPALPHMTRRAQPNMEPFTDTSFVLVFDKPPSWSRRVGDPPVAKPVLGPGDVDRRMPDFLRRLRPLMRLEDLEVYARRADFRSAHAELCVDCTLKLTGGLALPTESELHSHLRRSPSPLSRPSSPSKALPPVVYSDTRPASRSSRPRSRQIGQKAIVSPSPSLTSSAIATSPSHKDTSGKTKKVPEAFWNRLAMPSTYLGRPQSVPLVERIRSESRLFGKRTLTPHDPSRHVQSAGLGYGGGLDDVDPASAQDPGGDANRSSAYEYNAMDRREDVSW